MHFLLLFLILLTHVTHPVNSFIKNKKNSNLNNFKDMKDMKENIELDLNSREKNIIKKINGFYGLIGPNIEMNNNDIKSLYDLFTGDGIIQGVFFNKGNLTFVKHLIKTEKVLYEEKNGKIPKNFFIVLILLFLNKVKLFPNIMGMANTAILNIKNKSYALFERDYPYLININFQEMTVNTLNKIHIADFQHFSGHSKVFNDNYLETIDYLPKNNIVNYYLLDSEFSVINKINFKFNYIPIIHDFYSNNDYLILIDSPLIHKIIYIFQKKIPIYLNNKKKTFIHIFDKKNNSVTKYDYINGFYIFHYAYIKDKDDTFEIYTSQYDELEFSNINLKGSYRMIEINKKNKTVFVHKNDLLEKYNLDFPIKFQDKVVLRNYVDRRINGFVITKDLNIVKTLFYENKHICGEHNIINIDNIPYLIFFNIEFEKETNISNNFISLVNLNNYNLIDINIKNNLNLGFHSIFLDNTIAK